VNDVIINNLKLIYKPLIMYYGEWNLLPGLEEIAKVEKGKNLFNEYLNRYYYMPLNVIFKDEELVISFKWAICSKLGESGRTLFFSKKVFLSNLIYNIEEYMDSKGDENYKEIKKILRDRKNVYRDVYNNGEESPYYQEIVGEYLVSSTELDFDVYVKLCKKKYTRLLTGYNAVMDLFDKSINVDKFIKCFDSDKLYLFTCYSLLKSSENIYEKYGKLDYNINALDTYRDIVKEMRKKDSFYNSHLLIDENTIYTIDDLFKEYDELLNRVNER